MKHPFGYLRSSALFLAGACTTASLQSPIANEALATPRHASVTKLAATTKIQSPSKTTTVQHLARGNNAYIGRLVIEAGAQIPEHRDSEEEYIFVLEGGGTVFIDGQDYRVESGDTIFMPANAAVRYINSNRPTVVIQVFAAPSPADKYTTWNQSPKERVFSPVSRHMQWYPTMGYIVL